MDRPRLYFIHIPKTAGSSLRSALTEAVGDQSALLLSTGHKRKQLEAAPLAQLRVIGGHVPFREFRRCRPCQDFRWLSFAVLREPVDRFLSMYNFLSQSDHPEHRRYRDMSVGRFARHYNRFWYKGLHMCWYFHPSARFAKAARVIDDNRIAVYTLPELDKLTADLGRVLGTPLRLGHLNPSRTHADATDLTALNLGFLDQDRLLYDRACAGDFPQLADLLD